MLCLYYIRTICHIGPNKVLRIHIFSRGCPIVVNCFLGLCNWSIHLILHCYCDYHTSKMVNFTWLVLTCLQNLSVDHIEVAKYDLIFIMNFFLSSLMWVSHFSMQLWFIYATLLFLVYLLSQGLCLNICCCASAMSLFWLWFVHVQNVNIP